MILSDLDPFFWGLIGWGIPNVVKCVNGTADRVNLLTGIPFIMVGITLLFSAARQDGRLEREAAAQVERCSPVVEVWP